MALKFGNKAQVYAALRRTVPKIDEALRGALAEAGAEMVAKARELVPVDTGDLSGSIAWQYTRATQADAGRSPAIVVQAGADSPADPAHYVRYVEFGTPETAKQPFFFPAYRLLRRRLRGKLARAMTKAIRAAGFK